jgi:hypothetical protein
MISKLSSPASSQSEPEHIEGQPVPGHTENIPANPASLRHAVRAKIGRRTRGPTPSQARRRALKVSATVRSRPIDAQRC